MGRGRALLGHCCRHRPAGAGRRTHSGAGGSARFIFVTDSGRIAAWGERGPDGKLVRVNEPSQEVFNGDPVPFNITTVGDRVFVGALRVGR